MIEPTNVIETITSQMKSYFPDSILTFDKDNHLYKYRSISNVPSSAQSRGQTIMVTKWISIFWVYIEIDFRRNESSTDYFIFFSLSVFKGEHSDPIKIPLFRAEWDNFDDNEQHPQPHWHFYEKSGLVQHISQFTDILEEEEISGFAAMIDEDNADNVDMSKMHFAMNASWDNNEGHIQAVNDDDTFTRWFIGLIGHIKYQLAYIS